MEELCERAKKLILRLLPGEEFGENPDAEELWDIIEEIQSKTKGDIINEEIVNVKMV